MHTTQTLNTLINMLEEHDEHVQIKVDSFLSSEGISGLGDQPFVCTLSYHVIEDIILLAVVIEDKLTLNTHNIHIIYSRLCVCTHVHTHTHMQVHARTSSYTCM